jgi:hypothetical protein
LPLLVICFGATWKPIDLDSTSVGDAPQNALRSQRYYGRFQTELEFDAASDVLRRRIKYRGMIELDVDHGHREMHQHWETINPLTTRSQAGVGVRIRCRASVARLQKARLS